jgi:phospholipase/carboxylesterase
MNRIQHCDAPQIIQTFQKSHTVAGSTRQRTSSGSLPKHGVFVPLHYEANYAYPLIVWLHSPGEDPGQLKRIMPLVSMRNYVAISPCGELISGHASNTKGCSGFGWRQNATSIESALDRVLACIDVATSRFNICESRIFLAGCDSGGTMAIRLGLLSPERFAGVVSVGGPFPNGLNPLARIESARRLPVMLGCRIYSVDYPMDQACDDLRLMHSAGMPTYVRQYNCQDELLASMFKDMNNWLMNIVTGGSKPFVVSSDQSPYDEHRN